MWKPTQQEALWFHGGNLHQSRHYSQFLSLQLKARMEGLETPVYGLQEVYHLSNDLVEVHQRPSSNSTRRALASIKSAVSNPSVNQL